MTLSISNNAGALMRLALLLILLSSSWFSYADTKQSSTLHTGWQSLLSKHVKTIDNGHSTALDYAAIQQQQHLLQRYLQQLSQITRVEFDAWSTSKQLAFLINAYNAWTVEFILTQYPNIESIKDLGHLFRSPWNKTFIPLLDKTRSLNDIEHSLIRGSGRYNDPRIHFAVNCASIGCPALREEAYSEAKLEQQLTEQTERFLADKKRNYMQQNSLYLSSIFKWYKDDFAMGFRGTQSTQAFILLYSQALTLTDEQQLALANQHVKIKFLDYNWELNDIH